MPPTSKTTTQKLTAIIERAIERGFLKQWLVKYIQPVDWGKYIDVVIRIEDKEGEEGKDLKFSIPDLIANAEFMRVLFGKGIKTDYRKPCPHCGGDLKISNPTGNCSHVHYPEDCEVCEKASHDYRYHQQQLVILDSDEERVSYLFEHMGGKDE